MHERYWSEPRGSDVLVRVRGPRWPVTFVCWQCQSRIAVNELEETNRLPLGVVAPVASGDLAYLCPNCARVAGALDG